jgi:hypothetical protein
MRKTLLLMMLLLGAVVQGAWADDGWSYYSGHESANKPEFKAWYNGRIDVCIIKTLGRKSATISLKCFPRQLHRFHRLHGLQRGGSTYLYKESALPNAETKTGGNHPV